MRASSLESRCCALCKNIRQAAPLPGDLQAALMSCCHLFIPAVDDPICSDCQKYYREHLKRHDGEATTHVTR